MFNLPFESRRELLASLDIVVSRAAGSMEQPDLVAVQASCRIVSEIDRLALAEDRSEVVALVARLAEARFESTKRSVANAALSALSGWERIS